MQARIHLCLFHGESPSSSSRDDPTTRKDFTACPTAIWGRWWTRARRNARCRRSRSSLGELRARRADVTAPSATTSFATASRCVLQVCRKRCMCQHLDGTMLGIITCRPRAVPRSRQGALPSASICPRRARAPDAGPGPTRTPVHDKASTSCNTRSSWRFPRKAEAHSQRVLNP